MSTDEKMWYSWQEALEYLRIDAHTMYRKMILYNFESRTLPGEKGQYIASEYVNLIKRDMYGTQPLKPTTTKTNE